MLRSLTPAPGGPRIQCWWLSFQAPLKDGSIQGVSLGSHHCFCRLRFLLVQCLLPDGLFLPYCCLVTWTTFIRLQDWEANLGSDSLAGSVDPLSTHTMEPHCPLSLLEIAYFLDGFTFFSVSPAALSTSDIALFICQLRLSSSSLSSPIPPTLTPVRLQAHEPATPI